MMRLAWREPRGRKQCIMVVSGVLGSRIGGRTAELDRLPLYGPESGQIKSW